jgi:Coenzyme PQQ synthesis protein D (PqqD)
MLDRPALPPALTPETMLTRADPVIEADLGDEAVLLDTSSGTAYRLNPAAAWLWERLSKPAPMSRLAEELGERFKIEAGRATADTEAFAAAMVGRGLLEAGP